MATCRRTRRLLGAYLYDDLNREETDYVRDHLQGCPRCAYELHSRKHALEVLVSHEADTALPEEFWKPFLSSLDERIANDALRRRRDVLQRLADALTTLSPALPRLALAGLSVIVGIAVGAALFGGGKQLVSQQELSDRSRLEASLRGLQAELQDDEIFGVVQEMKLDLITSGNASGLNKLRTIEAALFKAASLGTTTDLSLENEIYEQAEHAILVRDYHAALSSFERFMEGYPESPRAAYALFMTAFANEALGNYTEAIGEYQRVYADCPRQDLCETALLRRVECHYKLGQYEQAAAGLRTFIEEHPDAPRSPHLCLMLADIYYDHLEAYADALLSYRRYTTMYADAFAANPRRERIAGRLKILAANSKYHWEPLRILAEASRAEGPRAYQLYAKLLSYYPNSGLVDVALDGMSSIGEAPGRQEVPSGLTSTVPLRTGPELFQEKIVAYRRLIKLSESPEVAAIAQFKIGDIYETKLGEYDAAREEYEKVLNEYPGTTHTFQAQSRINLLALRHPFSTRTTPGAVPR